MIETMLIFCLAPTMLFEICGAGWGLMAFLDGPNEFSVIQLKIAGGLMLFGLVWPLTLVLMPAFLAYSIAVRSREWREYARQHTKMNSENATRSKS